jgi:5-methyltetrahydropteroyltriglutamate--homocysteine methyltransferase
MIRAHADVVGSLLRPQWLLKAQKESAAGAITPAEFKKIEDRAVDEAVMLQEEAGLDIVTDGEMRRLSFQGQMTAAVDGFADCGLDAFLWGHWYGDASTGERTKARPPSIGVAHTLRRKRHLCAEEFTYLRARTVRTPKVSLTSPSLWANFWSPECSSAGYPTLDSFLADIVAILRDEVAELVRLGATYIQLDAPHYPLLVDPRTRTFYEQQGWNLLHWLERGIDMDNAVVGEFPDVTFGFHMCRGNQGSRWLAAGGYDPIAKAVFQRIRAQRLLLEYDDSRAGSFEPLRQVPDDKMVVLGLVTTKSPRLETPAELAQRIGDARRFLPLERLALSPQCGFASSIIGNRLSTEDQKRKLRLVVESAKEIWG